MENKKFKMIDESFICEVCKKEVKPLGYTARDHCPYCLSSLHVDINPGDRKNECKGLLKPIGVEKFKDTYKIIYILNNYNYQFLINYKKKLKKNNILKLSNIEYLSFFILYQRFFW